MDETNRFNSTTINDVKDDVATLKDDIASLVSGLSANGIDVTTSKLSETKEAAVDAAKVAQTKVCDGIAERPLTSVLMAFGAGALVAHALGRKSA